MIAVVIKRIPIAAGILLALVAAGSAPAGAQAITSPYRFIDTPHAFYAFGTYVFTDRGTLDTGPGGGYAGGIAYNYRVTGPFNLSARISYLPTSRRVYDDNSVAADSVELRADPMTGLEQLGTADMSLLLVDAALRFDVTGPRTWRRIQPYFLIGAGGAFELTADNTIEELLPTNRDLRVRFRNGLTGNVGFGTELYLSDHFTIRMDARDVLWKLDIPEGFRVTGRVIGEDEWAQTAHLSLGLTFRF